MIHFYGGNGIQRVQSFHRIQKHLYKIHNLTENVKCFFVNLHHFCLAVTSMMKRLQKSSESKLFYKRSDSSEHHLHRHRHNHETCEADDRTDENQKFENF